MPLQAQFLLFLSAGALCCDLFLQKVPNLWIFLGIPLGFSDISKRLFWSAFLPEKFFSSHPDFISTVYFSRNGGWRFKAFWYAWNFSQFFRHFFLDCFFILHRRIDFLPAVFKLCLFLRTNFLFLFLCLRYFFQKTNSSLYEIRKSS